MSDHVHNHDGAGHSYKRYIARLDDIKLLADVVCQLDVQINHLPPDSEDAQYLTALVEHAHDTLIRILGQDAGQVYAADNAENAA